MEHSKATSVDKWVSPEPALRAGSLDLNDYPYLQRLEQLQSGYPALWFLLGRLRNDGDEGRRLIHERYIERKSRAPGRCAMLSFRDDGVESAIFHTADELRTRLAETPSKAGIKRRRLFILEDMEPKFVDALGHHLSVDPLVFSEQMNTWNSTSSQSVPHRALPSLNSPRRSFTMRYYEMRTLDDEHSVGVFRNSMTYAINRRRYERWRDVDLKSVDPDRRHAFVRRCASFWTSQRAGDDEWDAVLMVDPPMGSCGSCRSQVRVQDGREDGGDRKRKLAHKILKPSRLCEPACLVLQDPRDFKTRTDLWKARNWRQRGDVSEVPHSSVAYHGGCQHLIVPPSSMTSASERLELMERSSQRDHASILDSLLFYWTSSSDTDLLKAANKDSVNSSYYLLKIVAQHWTHQLELIAHGVANTEWFADDHEANINSHSSTSDWKRELGEIAVATKDINYMRRQLSHFESAMLLNLERLGVQIGCEAVDDLAPLAIKDAQQDLLTISARLRPFRERVDDLSSLANEVAGLQASFKSINDGEMGLRLSVFAGVVFPLTLVAGIFSMADGYLPGDPHFWVFWASSVPLALVLGLGLMYGRQPEFYARRTFGRLTAQLAQRARPEPVECHGA